MTRKDYVLIAAAIKEARAVYKPGTHAESIAIETVADHIAVELGRDNQRFDRERFLKAAGVQS